MHLHTTESTVRKKPSALPPIPPPYAEPDDEYRDDIPSSAAEAREMSIAAEPFRMTPQEVGTLETIHFSFGRILAPLDKATREAIGRKDELGRTLLTDTPRAFRDIPHEPIADTNPVLWSAEILLDERRDPFVASINVHACHRHAGIIAKAASAASPHSLTTTARLSALYREWISGRGIDAAAYDTDGWEAAATEDPLDRALHAMIRRTIRVPHVSNTPVQYAFRLPLRHRRTSEDDLLISRYREQSLESFVHPNWRLSHLASLAPLFAPEYAQLIPSTDLKAAQMHAVETRLAPKPDSEAWKGLAANADQWVARFASPFMLQHVATDDLTAAKRQLTEIAKKSPGKLVFQRKIPPLITKVSINGLNAEGPIRLVTLAYGEKLIAVAAVVRITYEGRRQRVAMNVNVSV